MSQREQMPSDQFSLCTEALRKAAMLVDEIQRSSDLSEGLTKVEVQMRLAKAREHFELAGFYLDKAIKASIK